MSARHKRRLAVLPTRLGHLLLGRGLEIMHREPTAPDYAWTDVSDKSNITIDLKASGGFTLPDFTIIAITQPSQHAKLAAEELRTTGRHLDSLNARLKHETQHASDFELSSGGARLQGPTGTTAGVAGDPFLEFKTEYRANWAQEEGFKPTDEELSKGSQPVSGVQLSPK